MCATLIAVKSACTLLSAMLGEQSKVAAVGDKPIRLTIHCVFF